MNSRTPFACVRQARSVASMSVAKLVSSRFIPFILALILFTCAAVTASARPAATDPVELSIPQLTVAAQTTVEVPLTISDTTDRGIIAYQFNLRYDPTVLQLCPVPVAIAGTLSESMAFAVNPNTPGLVRVAVYGAYPLADEGVLLKVRFNAIGNSGSSTDLTWEDVLLNEGDPGHTLIDGRLHIGGAIMLLTSVRGRIIWGGGVVPFGRVELIGDDGIYRTVLANAKGYFEFGRVPAEQNYTLSVAASTYRFTPIVINVRQSPIEVELQGDCTEKRDR